MPKPLFTKLIVQVAIGFFFILIGCAYGIRLHDRMFLLMSIAISIYSLFRAISLFHLAHSNAYLVLRGTCICRQPALFKKIQEIDFVDSYGCEYHFSFDKNVKLLQGHHYCLYFRKVLFLDPNVRPAEDHLSSSDFLGYEELTALPQEGE